MNKSKKQKRRTLSRPILRSCRATKTKTRREIYWLFCFFRFSYCRRVKKIYYSIRFQYSNFNNVIMDNGTRHANVVRGKQNRFGFSTKTGRIWTGPRRTRSHPRNDSGIDFESVFEWRHIKRRPNVQKLCACQLTSARKTRRILVPRVKWPVLRVRVCVSSPTSASPTTIVDY